MKVKSHYFGARLLKPTTDSRAALMLSPMTTTTVTGPASRGTGCCVCARPRRADRPPSSIPGCARAAYRCSCRRTRWCRWQSGPCSSRSWTGWSKATMSAARPAERDLSVCLHRRLSGHLCAPHPGARSGGRRAEVTRIKARLRGASAPARAWRLSPPLQSSVRAAPPPRAPARG